VPYAFKAAEADTLGGRKPEDFVSLQQLTTLLGNGVGELLVPTPAALDPGTGMTGASNLGLPQPEFSPFSLPSGVAVGSELVSNGVDRPPVYQTKAVLNARDYGVTCSGTTDDTAAMQKAVNAACPSGGIGTTLIVPQSCRIKISSTLVFSKCNGVTLDGEQSQGQATMYASGHGVFVWAGSAGGTVLEVNQTRDSAFKNFSIDAGSANIGLLIDEIGTVTNIVTNNHYDNLGIWNGSASSSFIAVSLCPTAPGNCESQNFNRIFVNCAGGKPTSTSNGTGIQYGPGGEPYYEYLHWYEANNCSQAISIPGGGASVNILDIDGGLMGSNYTDLSVNAGRDISYRHVRSENAIAQIVIGNPSYSGAHDLTVEENSFSGLTNNTTTISYPFFNTGGILRVIKNDWDSNPTVTPFGPTGPGGFVGSLDSQDNNYPNSTLCPVVCFVARYRSSLDQSFNTPACANPQ